VSGYVATLNCSSPTLESLFEALEKELLKKKLFRPVKHFSNPLTVSIDMTVVGILGVVKNAQLQYNMNFILFIFSLCFFSSFEEDKSPLAPYVYLHNTGRVYDDKPLRVISSCKLGIYAFPFDIQNCTLTFGSYIHFGKMIQERTAALTLAESIHVSKTNGEWELLLLCSAISHFQIILRRRPILYVLNLILPSCFLVTLDVFSFLLPPQSVDRSAVKMTLILGYTVFLLIMNDLLPVTGNEMPLLNSFFSLSLALMVASLLETLLIIHIHFHSSQYRVAPHWLSVLMLQYIAVVVCVRPQKRTKRITSVSSHSLPVEPALYELRLLSRDLLAIRIQIDKLLHDSICSQEWKMIGLVIDRLLFGFYFVFVIFTFITIAVIWHWSNSYLN
uniref:Neurotransmitter-gated ion-channel ligand-binding domain-containing protein n=1 Tax=Mola mola TaxID=94237 RepID=A0A3Q3W5F4_MOLML